MRTLKKRPQYIKLLNDIGLNVQVAECKFTDFYGNNFYKSNGCLAKIESDRHTTDRRFGSTYYEAVMRATRDYFKKIQETK